jgi:catechol 2,3-dioxygenase-like lactoylglutathione lyase family enzyme
MALKLGFSHVVLKVRDMATMLDFYTNVLEFDIVDRGPLNLPNRGDLDPIESEIVFLSQDPYDHHQLAMLPVRGDDEPTGSVDHMAFRCADLAGVRNLAERLTGDGVSIRPVSHGNTWSCYFKDPEGNGIEVYTPTPYHVSQPQVRPVDLSLDDEAALAWIEENYRNEPGFRPIAEYEAERAAELADRS